MQLFALERYDDTGVDRPASGFPTLPDGVRLAVAVHLPADEVVLALVEGPDADTVTGAVTAAGWRVDRINTAAWLAGRPAPTPEVIA